jgi:hypothetical protein
VATVHPLDILMDREPRCRARDLGIVAGTGQAPVRRTIGD